MKKRTYPLGKVYQLLEPGPVVLVTTAHKGKTNVMTMSWQTMLEFEPPQLACVISNRNFSFELLKRSNECVINIPTKRMAPKVIACGNCSGRNVDKFKKFGLTALPAASVKAPLIDECFANLECRVVDTRLVNQYNLFILQVQKAWVAPQKSYPKTLHHYGYGRFMTAGGLIRLPSKMK